MVTPRRFAALVFPVLFILSAVPLEAQTTAEAPAASLEWDSIPASGSHAVVLTVDKPGRYAVTVASPTGVSLQLVDRMAGPGEIFGSPGNEDGRLDAILDRGTYLIRTQGPANIAGEARLKAFPFTEFNAPRAPLLVPLKLVETSLEDLQQRSYWLDLAQADFVILEAAGRSLADLRVWKDGGWLVDLDVESAVLDPVAGKPLASRRISRKLGAGLYLITAYGGKAVSWAEDSPEHPFYLRLGLPTLGSAGRRYSQMSPFGTDRWLVPNNANFFRAELPEPNPLTLRVGNYIPSNAFHSAYQEGAITKKSREPSCQISTANGNGKDFLIVEISTAPGSPFVLQYLEALTEKRVDHSGNYWISTLHTGHPQDSQDATALLTKIPIKGREFYVDGSMPVVSAAGGWKRKANLLGITEVFFEVKDTGSYVFSPRGIECSHRIEPFLLYPPEGYRSPDFRTGQSTWELDKGIYILTLNTGKAGILTWSLALEGNLIPLEPAVMASAAFPNISVDRRDMYRVSVNVRAGITSTILVRERPLLLSDPLPMTLRPGEKQTVPFKVSGEGYLRAVTEQGTRLKISTGSTWSEEITATDGQGNLTVRNDGNATVLFSLGYYSKILEPGTPLPPITDALLAKLPKFPVLTAKEPQFLDLDRQSERTYLVSVAEPALYRLESTGLLHTGGNLRTRMITSYDRQEANGYGRNFLIQTFLREGEYQVTVSSKGESAGHLGLTLGQTVPVTGGRLPLDVPARISLAPGQAAEYRFTITEAGTYRFRTLGLGRTFRCILWDEDGWPLEKPGIASEVVRFFEAGTYRLLILPEATESRRVTLLSRLEEPPEYEGHGPHLLPPDTEISHTWKEPSPGGERVPDQWEFTLPAEAEVHLSLTTGMAGTLTAEKGTRQVWEVKPSLTETLPRGTYRLTAVTVRPNNYFPYTLSLKVEPLMAGMSREVQVPGEIPISIGEDSVAEFASFGTLDAAARLYDAKGALLASADDRSDDWNFHLAKRLRPGQYRLRVNAAGDSRGSCEVSLHVAAVVEEPPLPLPAKVSLTPGATMHHYLVTVPPGAGGLIAAVTSDEAVGCALDRKESEGWTTVASETGRSPFLAVPVEDGGRYQLRVWSVDRRNSPATVGLVTAQPYPLTESQLARGVEVPVVNGLPVALASVEVRRPGLFRLDAGEWRLRASAKEGTGCGELPGGVLAGQGLRFWLAASASPAARNVRVTGERLILYNEPLTVRIEPGQTILCDVRSSPSSPVAVSAFSLNSWPGVAVAEYDAGEPLERTGSRMAVGQKEAVSVLLRSIDPLATAWVGSEEAGFAEVRLTRAGFPPPDALEAPWGVTDGLLEGVSALAMELPEGDKRLHLSLSRSTIAVTGNPAETTHWGGGRAVDEWIVTRASSLTLLHSGSGSDPFTIEILRGESGAAGPALTVERPFEISSPVGFRVRVAVEAVNSGATPPTLHVRGPGGEPLLITDTGAIRVGRDVSFEGTAGTLVLPAGPGWTVAWLDQGSGTGVWGGGKVRNAKEVEPPATVSLSGTSQFFRFRTEGTVLLHMEADGPAAALIQGVHSTWSDAFPEGCLLDTFLAEPVDIGLRALGGGSLWGTARFTTTPVTGLVEGQGPEELLPAGGSRLFSFVVAEEGPVGVGVRAYPDRAECTLMDAQGKPMGKGVVQMPTLQPGTYLLKVTAPPSQGPIAIRPAVVGLVPPKKGPPPEEIKKYLDMMRNEPLATELEGAGE